MELIDRYIHAVVNRLSKTHREEAERKLRERIEGLLSERKGEAPYSKNEVVEVLKELGEPSQVADEYRGFRRFLIGPDLFETYLRVLKIIITVVLFGVTLGKSFELVTNPPNNIPQGIGEFVRTLFSGVLQSFTWVTIFFAIREHFKFISKEKIVKKEWSVTDLPPIPPSAARIRPSEPIVSLVFSALFTILFINFNHWIGVYHFEGGTLISVTPIFSPEGIKQEIPWLLVLLGISLLKDSLKLMVGTWTIILALLNVILNVASLAIWVDIFTNPFLWNNNFVQDLYANGVITADMEKYLQQNWPILRKSILYLVAYGFIIDSIASLYKAIKYKWL